MKLSDVKWTMTIPGGMAFLVFIIAIIYCIVILIANFKYISDQVLFWMITKKNENMFYQLCSYYGSYSLLYLAYYMGIRDEEALLKIAFIDFISSGKVESKCDKNVCRMIFNKKYFSDYEFNLVCEVMTRGGDIIITNTEDIKNSIYKINANSNKTKEFIMSIIEDDTIPVVDNDIWYMKQYIKKIKQKYPNDIVDNINDIFDMFLNFDTVNKRIILAWIFLYEE